MKFGVRRGSFNPSFNSIILLFLMSIACMILMMRGLPRENEVSNKTVSYVNILQKVRFLGSLNKTKYNASKGNQTRDNIFPSINQEMNRGTNPALKEDKTIRRNGAYKNYESKKSNSYSVPKDFSNINSKFYENPKNNLNLKDSRTSQDSKDPNSISKINSKDSRNLQNSMTISDSRGPSNTSLNRTGVFSNDEITESEEDFNIDEEFHPPTSSKKIYDKLGSLLQTFFSSINDLKKMQDSSKVLQGNYNPMVGVEMDRVHSPILHKKHQNVVHPTEKSIIPSKVRPKRLNKIFRRDGNDLLRKRDIGRIRNAKRDQSPHAWILEAVQDHNRNKSLSEVRQIFNELEKPTSDRGEACANILTVGGRPLHHGQFNPTVTQLVCKDEDFEASFRKRCIVYSFGIGGNWDFENSFAENGCKVWAFDATLRKKPLNAHKNIQFNNVGLGTKDEVKTVNNEQVQYYTLRTLVEKLKHSKSTISYLKINLKGEEWPILNQLIREHPTLSNNILQMGLTTHLHTALIDHKLYGLYLRVIKQLKSLGFRMFTSRKVEVPKEVYREPLLDNRRVTLTHYLAFIRI